MRPEKNEGENTESESERRSCLLSSEVETSLLAEGRERESTVVRGALRDESKERAYLAKLPRGAGSSSQPRIVLKEMGGTNR